RNTEPRPARGICHRARRLPPDADELTSLARDCAQVLSLSLSLPGLTRQSINLRKDFLQKGMDARIKPAHDGSIIALHPRERAARHVMQYALLDQDHREIGNAADNREHENGDEYHGRIRLPLAEGEQIAEPKIASDQLAHHDADDGERRGDAQAGE